MKIIVLEKSCPHGQRMIFGKCRKVKNRNTMANLHSTMAAKHFTLAWHHDQQRSAAVKRGDQAAVDYHTAKLKHHERKNQMHHRRASAYLKKDYE